MSNEAKKVEEADLDERIKGFNSEVGPLLGKYELGLGAEAFFTSDGRVTSKPVLVSARKKAEEKAELASA